MSHRQHYQVLPRTTHNYRWSDVWVCCCYHPLYGRKRRYSDANNDRETENGNAVASQRKPPLLLCPKIGKIRVMVLIFIICCCVGFCFRRLAMRTTNADVTFKLQHQHFLSSFKNINSSNHCAINFYGLPRQYYHLTHNSILQNVIIPNLRYNCDYYIHYYNDTTIESTQQQRGADVGHGNTYFDPNEILLLQNDILQLHYDYHHQNNMTTPDRPPIIQYSTTSDIEFHQQYTSLLQTIHQYQHPTTNKYLYLPLSEALPFSNTTLTNIIKMWHSQQSVFELMDKNHIYPKKHYTRVGMFRNDVLYVTRIDIYQIPSADMNYRYQNKRQKNRRRRRRSDSSSSGLSYDLYNQYAVIPDFANFPVNDRMIYGPYDAILIYATFKFRLLHAHIHSIINQQKQYGIHSEQYLYHTILPMIQQYGQVTILQRPDICFLRVRTDYSIRINDCSTTCTSSQQQNNIHTIMELLQRSCQPQLDVTLPHVPFLLCPPLTTDSNRSIVTFNRHSDQSTTTIEPQWELCSSIP